MGDYCTVAEVKASLGLQGTTDDATVGIALDAFRAAVDAHCGWRFDQTPGTRVYRPDGSGRLALGEFCLAATPTSVHHDSAEDGTWSTTIAASSYEVHPVNAIRDGIPWAYTDLHGVGGYAWPVSAYGRHTIRITGTFGWPAVPPNVKQATIIGAAWLWSSKATPAGVVVTDFGPIDIRSSPQAERLLAPFRRPSKIAAIGGCS